MEHAAGQQAQEGRDKRNRQGPRTDEEEAAAGEAGLEGVCIKLPQLALIRQKHLFGTKKHPLFTIVKHIKIPEKVGQMPQYTYSRQICNCSSLSFTCRRAAPKCKGLQLMLIGTITSFYIGDIQFLGIQCWGF